MPSLNVVAAAGLSITERSSTELTVNWIAITDQFYEVRSIIVHQIPV